MTKKENVLRTFLHHPDALSYIQIEKVLLSLHFEKIEAKGSHKKFKHSNLQRDIIIPVHNNDCKIFYKKQVAKIIKQFI